MVSQAVLFAPTDRHDDAPAPSGSPSPGLALLPIGNKPLVLHAVEELAAAGVDEIAVVSETEVADDVRDALSTHAGVRLVADCAVDSQASFMDALRSAAPALRSGPFLVHLCDSLHRNGLGPAIAGGPMGHDDVVALVQPPQRGVTPVAPGLSGLRTAGVYVFGEGVLDLCDEPDESKRWDSQIAAAADRLEAGGGHIELRTVEDCWRYRRRPDVLLQANRFFLSGLRSGPTEAWVENTDLQGPVVVDPSARLRSTTVRGPVIIGPDVEISDAYIGPYSSIGRGVVIENAEVEHSIILPGASIRHLGGRLEASVVGSGARVFRDFRLPRAFRLNVGENAEVALT